MSGGRHRGRARPRGLLLSPNEPAGEAVASALRLQLQVFSREEAGARAGEAEPVHQLRVATRRLRAGLGVGHACRRPAATNVPSGKFQSCNSV